MRKKKKSKKTNLLILLMIMGILIVAGCVAGSVIKPNLEEIAQIRAEAIVSKTVNKALRRQFEQEVEEGSLFEIKNDSNGKMQFVQADSMRINIFMSELSVSLQEDFQKMGGEAYRIPIGALLGSQIFSQMGPCIKIEIIPLSVSSMDYRTEFETKGINQTKYKVYVEMECKVRVLAPFSSGDFKVKNTVPVAEAVILGDVPGSFVQVPEEDILDVTDE